MAGPGSTQQNTGGQQNTGTSSPAASGSTANIQDRAEQMGAAAGRKVGEVLSKAQEAVTAATQKAQDTATNVAQRAQDTASTFAQAASARAHDTLSTVGGKVSSFAGSIRESAPGEGVLGSAASAVADRLEAGGRYLQEERLEDMAGDLATVVRSYPLQALCVGFSVGILVGMALKRG